MKGGGNFALLLAKPATPNFVTQLTFYDNSKLDQA